MPIFQAIRDLNLERLVSAIAYNRRAVDVPHRFKFEGTTPMHDAVQRGWVAGLRVLIAFRSKAPTMKDHRGYTPLHIAAEGGFVECFHLLAMIPEVDLYATCNDLQTPLMKAAKNGYTRIVKYIVDKSTSGLNACDIHKNTALAYSIMNGHTKVFDLLIGNIGISIMSINVNQRTLLHEAVFVGSITMTCTILVLSGNNMQELLNARDISERTALDYAHSMKFDACRIVLNFAYKGTLVFQ